jgi:hypothetical protein
LKALPPELARDRKQADAEYDRAQAALSRLSPARDQAEIDRLSVQLREIQARQEEIAARIRQASPRVAALRNPQPLRKGGISGTSTSSPSAIPSTPRPRPSPPNPELLTFRRAPEQVPRSPICWKSLKLVLRLPARP